MTDETEHVHEFAPAEAEWRRMEDSEDDFRLLLCASCGETAIEIRPGSERPEPEPASITPEQMAERWNGLPGQVVASEGEKSDKPRKVPAKKARKKRGS